MDNLSTNLYKLDDFFKDRPDPDKKKRKVVIKRSRKLNLKDFTERKTDLDLQSFSKEEMILMLQELDDDFDDHEICRLRLYKSNHEVARQLHLSEKNIVLATGGNRSGKTQTLMVDFQIRLTGIMPHSLVGDFPDSKWFPNQRLRVVSTDFPNGIDKVILPLYYGPFAWFPQSLVNDYNSKSRTLLVNSLFGGTSMVEFMSYDQDVEKFQGTSRHAVGYDEEPPQSIRDECKMRVMDVDGQECFSMTPTKGLSWTMDALYEKRGREVAFSEERELVEGQYDDKTILLGDPDYDTEVPDGDEDIDCFVFFSIHNPNIKQDRVLKEASKMTEAERRMRIFGEYISKSGRVYDKYDESKHLVKEPFDIPEDWPRYMALDTHARTPHAVLFLAVDPMGRKWFYDELWTEEACTLKSLVLQMYELEFNQVKENFDSFPNGFNRDMIEMEQVNGIWMLKKPVPFKRPWIVRQLIEPAAQIPSPLTGTTLATELATVYRSFLPGSKDLQRGIIAVNSNFENDDTFVFPHLKRTRYELKNYVWDDFKGPSYDQKTKKQSPKDKDDHFMENMRRILVESPIFIRKADFEEDISGWRRY
jgi:phage terminase large subunit-like protein